eukprot:scaffold4895_cov38-Phaeocystis_antarctica.AAC.1
MQRGGERAGLEGVIPLWRTERTYAVSDAAAASVADLAAPGLRRRLVHARGLLLAGSPHVGPVCRLLCAQRREPDTSPGARHAQAAAGRGSRDCVRQRGRPLRGGAHTRAPARQDLLGRLGWRASRLVVLLLGVPRGDGDAQRGRGTASGQGPSAVPPGEQAGGRFRPARRVLPVQLTPLQP